MWTMPGFNQESFRQEQMFEEIKKRTVYTGEYIRTIHIRDILILRNSQEKYPWREQKQNAIQDRNEGLRGTKNTMLEMYCNTQHIPLSILSIMFKNVCPVKCLRKFYLTKARKNQKVKKCGV